MKRLLFLVSPFISVKLAVAHGGLDRVDIVRATSSIFKFQLSKERQEDNKRDRAQA